MNFYCLLSLAYVDTKVLILNKKSILKIKLPKEKVFIENYSNKDIFHMPSNNLSKI